jgi:hypothetical protein
MNREEVSLLRGPRIRRTIGALDRVSVVALFGYGAVVVLRPLSGLKQKLDARSEYFRF